MPERWLGKRREELIKKKIKDIQELIWILERDIKQVNRRFFNEIINKPASFLREKIIKYHGDAVLLERCLDNEVNPDHRADLEKKMRDVDDKINRLIEEKSQLAQEIEEINRLESMFEG